MQRQNKQRLKDLTCLSAARKKKKLKFQLAKVEETVLCERLKKRNFSVPVSSVLSEKKT